MSLSSTSKGPTLEHIIATAWGHDWRERVAVDTLLDLGDIVAGTDYAVQHFWDPWHPQFFGKRRAVLHSINRGLRDHHHNAITRDRIQYLCAIRSRPHKDPQADDRIQQIREGLTALQAALRCLTPEGADSLCRTIADVYYNEDPNAFEDGDWQLEAYGYTLADEALVDDDGDEVFMYQPPTDLVARLGRLQPAYLCDVAERLRQAWRLPSPSFPRGDYAVIATLMLERLPTVPE